MKIRVTLITENDVPVEALGPFPEARIKTAWDILLRTIELESDGADRGCVESVEIIE